MLAEDLLLDRQPVSVRGIQDNSGPKLRPTGTYTSSGEIGRRQTRANVGDTSALLENSMEWDLNGTAGNTASEFKGKGKEPMAVSLPTHPSEVEQVTNDTSRKEALHTHTFTQATSGKADKEHCLVL
ncbi:hypothetical protein SARC_05569 [Sphaeroforma arctica JP610]|uniref:Uncharacterized protein n=1 Tax=Sphaeroforma arctica JP610 TaxID=667725 RepID=A0A0L0FZX5_9EUKA|nr:hypothetical protein SARC_05569 [Sphaeroforma arctica JP610]KNC82149.1 hypothetical protein SARC_05569 [Sphaeroforma arctica JP610]|eukprot:XP_014156051.1 hypothetical protein SARC_05569 [Sphaeroforma arctica JP610]